MADKLMIVMLNTDLKNPAELGAPFFQASVAAAMELDVEIVFSGGAAELAVNLVSPASQLSKWSRTAFST